MTTNHCPNPLCKSPNLVPVNLTGYTDLVCQDCGETVVSDLYGDMEREQTRYPFAECETCGPLDEDEVYEAEPRPDQTNPVYCCVGCTQPVLIPPPAPDEYTGDEPDWAALVEELENDDDLD